MLVLNSGTVSLPQQVPPSLRNRWSINNGLLINLNHFGQKFFQEPDLSLSLMTIFHLCFFSLENSMSPFAVQLFFLKAHMTFHLSLLPI